MRNIFILLFFWLITGCEQVETYEPGETFIKFFGTEYKETGVDLIVLEDSYMLLGNTEASQTQSSIMLVKTDKKGNELWQKEYPTSDIDRAVGMIQLENNEIVILGNRNDTTGILCYTNVDGDEFENTTPIILTPQEENSAVRYNSIENLDEGGFLIVGEIRSTQNQSEEWDMISLKLNDDGTIIWEKVEGYQGGGDDLGNSSSEDLSQNYYLFGSVDITKVNSDNNEVTVSDMRTVRVNFLGNIVWDKQISTFENDFGVKIYNYNNDFYVIGRRETSNSQQSIIFSKLSDNGDFEALVEYGTGITVGNDMVADQSGIYITGTTNTGEGATDRDILILKLDFQGNKLWETIVGYEGVDYGSKIYIENDNSILIVGTGFFGNNEKISLIKVDSQGNLSKE